MIIQQLRHLGFRAEVVPDGRVALERWRSGRFAPLLTDLQMPEMDGYQLTAAIRTAEEGASRIPITALTANALKEEAHHCRDVGMARYLTKPVRMEMLGHTLRRWLAVETSRSMILRLVKEGFQLPTPRPGTVQPTDRLQR